MSARPSWLIKLLWDQFAALLPPREMFVAVRRSGSIAAGFLLDTPTVWRMVADSNHCPNSPDRPEALKA